MQTDSTCRSRVTRASRDGREKPPRTTRTCATASIQDSRVYSKGLSAWLSLQRAVSA
jgi:hypothetical protein